ncbi:MAG: hypothetical protein ABSA13_15145 [Beijerinckiaceae bacterium]|jgi:hypothetical protein
MQLKFQSESRPGFWVALASIALISTFGSIAIARAASCDDQKGKLIFEDTFTDDSGGWESDSNSKVSGGTYVIHLDPKHGNWSELNGTFNASEADYCMEVVVPKSIAADNSVIAGLLFWGTDYDNFFDVQILSDGRVQIFKKAATKWAMIGEVTNPSMKLDPGSVAVIRVLAAGNLIAPSVNGIDLKKVRAPMPSGPLRFGVYAETTKDTPASGADITVKRIRVTEVK